MRFAISIAQLLSPFMRFVELKLRDPATFTYVMWPWTVRRLAIALDEPQAFVDALTAPPAA